MKINAVDADSDLVSAQRVGQLKLCFAATLNP